MSLDAQEFIRRYLLHVLPKGFMRIRHYGLNGNRTKRHKLAQARTALDCLPPAPVPTAPETIEAFWLRIARLDIHQCPTAAAAGCTASAHSPHAPTARRDDRACSPLARSMSG